VRYSSFISEATLSTLSHSDARDDSSIVVADELVLLLDCDRPLTSSARYRLDGIDEVVIGRGTRRHAERRGRRLVLELPDRRVTFPDTVGAALGALLGGGTHVVGELPDMPETDQVVLVRRLLREGVVVPAARP
jgi:hypothetical protein